MSSYRKGVFRTPPELDKPLCKCAVDTIYSDTLKTCNIYLLLDKKM